MGKKNAAATPALIAIDWGTSSFRAALLDHDGRVRARLERAAGILAVGGDFTGTLNGTLGPWLAEQGIMPIMMSGMIGSKQGWREAPYVRCPAGLGDLAAAVIEIASGGGIYIIPGVDTRNDDVPDVMRGEETQIFGALTLAGTSSGVFVLPGTHSKWVTVDAGRIVGFKSYMTGEIFAALKAHTILGRLMADAADPAAFDLAGFDRGVVDGARGGGPGDLLNRIFATRTLRLFEELPATAAADYLSGLLIGAELASATVAGAVVTVIGSGALTARYVRAAGRLNISIVAAPSDCAAHGAFTIAKAVGLVVKS